MPTGTPRWSSGGMAQIHRPRAFRALVLGLTIALGALAAGCGGDSGDDEFDCEEDEECDDLVEVF